MTKIFQAFLTGIFFTFILDFFIFLGIKQGYIDFYNIDLYYNILFADNQNIFIYTLFSAILGFIVTYIDNNKFSFIVIGVLFTISLSTLIPSIGHSLGEMLLMKKNVVLKDAKHIFYGDIYYDGRTQITFYDNDLKKIILLDKKDLIDE
ncbi:hypothetical protein [Sulfurimonas sp.]|uniref:hypothetical protein n=1 Tax=Sulfurimonas sp. TaxID=2022749 RepID=UPI002AAF2C74|nr:hypothetical protein [Sulfurimonas sp.]